MTTTTSTLPVWGLDHFADDLATLFGDSYRAEYRGLDLTVEACQWAVDSYEHCITGPYPGTPDWNEHHYGHGQASSPTEARWAAYRCAERVSVMLDVVDWEMTEAIESGNPDGDPGWWKS